MTPEPVVARVPGSGADVLVDHDGTGVVRTSSGTFLRLRHPPAGLVGALSGAPADDPEAGAYAEKLAAQMAAREDADAERRWPSARRGVGLVGHGAPVEALADALTGWGVSPARLSADAAASGRGRPGRPWDLVIAYADSPAERARWDLLDTLPGEGVAWLRAYREGGVCFVDPISLTPGDPTAEQVRRRRLAASPVPRQLDAWQRAAAGPRDELPPAARTLLAGRILTVALAWAQQADTLEGYRNTLWRLVASTGTLSEHPVLAYDPPPALDGAAARPS
ncbi:hypothetical protein ACFPZ0_00185 [Streptomonospora nanhaiensis]|uniref:hypothetical protein n=1 Tax=Streptomonospora nanhaiensis TaxID=1323731 RepID=UPI001C38397E|nr:hypothetical protein [Streptomonospora nanhaiensis]MBV2364170.1 hypothetical protein [Streptomonospora nanhaiensis]MBX9386710.1 hypothetical protein [Streptomonospora nanhaiensis]